MVFILLMTKCHQYDRIPFVDDQESSDDRIPFVDDQEETTSAMVFLSIRNKTRMWFYECKFPVTERL